MPWYYLCGKCHKKLFKVEGGSRVDCAICGEKGKLPEAIKLCTSCSYDTKMCMSCGAGVKIGDDFDEMMRKASEAKVKSRKKRKRRKGA